jgi:hypothetical protein
MLAFPSAEDTSATIPEPICLPNASANPVRSRSSTPPRSGAADHSLTTTECSCFVRSMATNPAPSTAQAQRADPKDQLAPGPFAAVLALVLVILLGSREAAIAWLKRWLDLHDAGQLPPAAPLTPWAIPGYNGPAALHALCHHLDALPEDPTAPPSERLWQSSDPGTHSCRGQRRPAPCRTATARHQPAALRTHQHGHDPPRRDIASHAHHPGTALCGPAIGVGTSLRR